MKIYLIVGVIIALIIIIYLFRNKGESMSSHKKEANKLYKKLHKELISGLDKDKYADLVGSKHDDILYVNLVNLYANAEEEPTEQDYLDLLTNKV